MSSKILANAKYVEKRAIVGALVIAVVVLVVYQPGLKIGFFDNDWWFTETVGRLGVGKSIAYFFDPSSLGGWFGYRPLQGALFAVEYCLFGNNPNGYYLVQFVLHIANCFLLFLLVRRVLKNWRIAFLSGLTYATLPIYSQVLVWPGVPDALMTFFYLSAIWFWIDYLESRARWHFALTVCALVAAMLSKELAVTLIPLQI